MRFLLAGALALSMASVSCDSDLGPPGSTHPTLENLWPNQDGRGWEYRVTQRVWPDSYSRDPYSYADSSDVPPLPGPADLVAWIDDPRYPEEFDEDVYSYSLTFDGPGVTGSGETGQRLQVGTAGNPSPREGELLLTPFILHGGVWEKTDHWMGRHTDLDGVAFRVLTPDLRPGAHFQDRVSAVFGLDVWVVGEVTVETSVGTFHRAVRCVYLFSGEPIGGRSTVFRPEGNGWMRQFYFGEVVYAPTVGPVYSYERHAAFSGDGDALGLGEFEMELTGLRSK
jgi:hypothetical protein